MDIGTFMTVMLITASLAFGSIWLWKNLGRVVAILLLAIVCVVVPASPPGALAGIGIVLWRHWRNARLHRNNRALLQAAKDGGLEQVRRFLNRGANELQEPLRVAVQTGQAAIVAELLQAPCWKPNERRHACAMALARVPDPEAPHQGCRECLDLIMATENLDPSNAFALAAYCGHTELVVAALSQEDPPEPVDVAEALDFATAGCYPETVKPLVSALIDNPSEFSELEPARLKAVEYSERASRQGDEELSSQYQRIAGYLESVIADRDGKYDRKLSSAGVPG